MNVENIGSIGVTIGGGFFGGVLIGYALKKILKVVALVVGLFFTGLAYLQYQQIIDIKWAKVQSVSQNIVMFANATTQIPGFNSGNHVAAIAMTNFGIPLTGSICIGFAVGFMKG